MVSIPVAKLAPGPQRGPVNAWVSETVDRKIPDGAELGLAENVSVYPQRVYQGLGAKTSLKMVGEGK